MRLLPRISLSGHGLAELSLGILLTIAALLVDLTDAGTLTLFVGGFLVCGVGVGAVQDQPLALQQSVDSALVVLLAGLGVLAGAAASAVAAVLLLAAACVVLLVQSGTRWTRPLA